MTVILKSKIHLKKSAHAIYFQMICMYTPFYAEIKFFEYAMENTDFYFIFFILKIIKWMKGGVPSKLDHMVLDKRGKIFILNFTML